jgi:hypothetical protein
MSKNTKQQDVWMAKYRLAKKYKRTFGNLYIPYKYKMDNVAIGSWLSTQRNAYKNKLPCLTTKRIELLEKIGIDWYNTNNPNYNDSKQKNKEFLNSAKTYFCKFNDLNVPYDYVDENGIALGKWLQSIRKTYSSYDEQILKRNPEEIILKENRLSVTTLKDLNAMHMVWKVDSSTDWNYKYELAKKFYKENGHLLIPGSYIANDEYSTNLGMWICYQRQLYNSGKELSVDKVERLNLLGMIWNPREEQWEQKYLLAYQYYKENGNLRIPKNYVVGDCKLGKWILWQRQAKRGNVRNSLSKEKIEKLNNIGMVWGN